MSNIFYLTAAVLWLNLKRVAVKQKIKLCCIGLNVHKNFTSVEQKKKENSRLFLFSRSPGYQDYIVIKLIKVISL